MLAWLQRWVRRWLGIDEILMAIASIPQPVPGMGPVLQLPKSLGPRKLDCGHTETSWAASKANGETACLSCHRRRAERV